MENNPFFGRTRFSNSFKPRFEPLGPFVRQKSREFFRWISRHGRSLNSIFLMVFGTANRWRSFFLPLRRSIFPEGGPWRRRLPARRRQLGKSVSKGARFCQRYWKNTHLLTLLQILMFFFFSSFASKKGHEFIGISPLCLASLVAKKMDSTEALLH